MTFRPALLLSPRLRIPSFIVLLLVVLLYLVVPYRFNLQDTLSYSTRPLWDKPQGPQKRLKHLQSPGVSSYDTAACERHDWKPRSGRVALWDATLISTELDMMEIRLTELWDTVDKFVVLESTHSMTGSSKNLSFLEHRTRFDRWSSKIEYKTHKGRAQTPPDGLFGLANEQRQAMTDFINSLNPPENALVLMADIDEVPFESTLRLLRACHAPLPLHLQLQNYLYSFEIPTLADSWRAQVHQWSEANITGGYRHGKSSDVILASSGWHCSFCFRTLREFAFKMLSASHLDRLLKRPNFRELLTYPEIQKRVCSGADLYDMLPEAYSWTDVIGLWGGAHKELGNVNLPRAVASDSRRFSYLLPDGCKREPGA